MKENIIVFIHMSKVPYTYTVHVWIFMILYMNFLYQNGRRLISLQMRPVHTGGHINRQLEKVTIQVRKQTSLLSSKLPVTSICDCRSCPSVWTGQYKQICPRLSYQGLLNILRLYLTNEGKVNPLILLVQQVVEYPLKINAS